MKSIQKMDTCNVIGATKKTDVQSKVDLLVQKYNKIYSSLDTPFCPIFIVWLCHIRLIKTSQSLYVTWSPVFCKTDQPETIQSSGLNSG